MSEQLKNLPEFIDSALNQFWYLHPEIYRDYCYHLGGKIDEVWKGVLEEADYIERWKKLPKERR